MSEEIKGILEQYTAEIQKIYGDSLKRVILYGSYARGDFHQDSDFDIMILVSLDDAGIGERQRKLYDMTYDFWWDHDVEINPIVKNEAHFQKWVKNYPLYHNVQKEGVSLYAA